MNATSCGHLVVFVSLVAAFELVFYFYHGAGETQQVPFRVVFVGGYRRSGTTLLKSILDVSESVSCGHPARLSPVVDALAEYRRQADSLPLSKSERAVVDERVALALRELIHGILLSRRVDRPVQCIKNPVILQHMTYLLSVLPDAKFVYIVRDGRASAYSEQLCSKSEDRLGAYLANLREWDRVNKAEYSQCMEVGPQRCHLVRYERLITRPDSTIRALMQFLGVEFTTALTEHHKYFGDRIVLSDSEWSRNQVRNPINTHSLDKWIRRPVEGSETIDYYSEAPMLRVLGYAQRPEELDYLRSVKLEPIVEANNSLVDVNQTECNN